MYSTYTHDSEVVVTTISRIYRVNVLIHIRTVQKLTLLSSRLSLLVAGTDKTIHKHQTPKTTDTTNGLLVKVRKARQSFTKSILLGITTNVPPKELRWSHIQSRCVSVLSGLT